MQNMQQVTTFHPSLESLQKAAFKYEKEIFETNVSYSFRLFENRQCTAIHIIYKNKVTCKI